MLKQQKRSKRTNGAKLNSKEQGTFAKRNGLKRREPRVNVDDLLAEATLDQADIDWLADKTGVYL